MSTPEVFRVNYFVGAMLAQGGNLWVEDSKIIFAPTSAIDRAMGAKNVEIPFDKIKTVSYNGSLSRTFHVLTEEKTHKFEGGQVKKFWENLVKLLPNREVVRTNGVAPTVKPPTPATPVPPNGLAFACENCRKELQPYFSFCPNCATRIKSICSSCHKAIHPGWSACAHCGWKFVAAENKAA